MCTWVQILTSNTVLVKTAGNSTKSTIDHYPCRLQGRQLPEYMRHGLCEHVQRQNAGGVCQEYHVTLA